MLMILLCGSAIALGPLIFWCCRKFALWEEGDQDMRAFYDSSPYRDDVRLGPTITISGTRR